MVPVAVSYRPCVVICVTVKVAPFWIVILPMPSSPLTSSFTVSVVLGPVRLMLANVSS